MTSAEPSAATLLAEVSALREQVEALRGHIAEIDDAGAIQALMYRYTAGCDLGFDVDAIASCFTEDGRWVSEGFGDNVGREQIRGYFRRVARVTPMALHYTTSPRIAIDPSGVRAVAQFYQLCLSSVRRRGSDEIDAVVILGMYVNRCAKVDGEWLFEELRANVRSVSEWTKGWALDPWRTR